MNLVLSFKLSPWITSHTIVLSLADSPHPITCKQIYQYKQIGSWSLVFTSSPPPRGAEPKHITRVVAYFNIKNVEGLYL
jgi:hypothetical protein